MFDKSVKLIGWLQNPGEDWDAEDFAVAGAMGCFDEKNSDEIHRTHKIEGTPYGPHEIDWERTKEVLMKQTSGKGHGAVSDLSAFAFSIDNLTRAATLFLCGPQYASHLQQSLRRATAERAFYVPEELDGTEGPTLMRDQFDLYTAMAEGKIPTEDARFILPLNTRTTITSLWDARELTHLHAMAQREGVPKNVRNTVEQMFYLANEQAPKLLKNRGTNYEVLAMLPSSQLYTPVNNTLENLIDLNVQPVGAVLLDHSGISMSEEAIRRAVMERDEAELANMKHYHFTFLAPMSISSFHQATRQRTWDQSVQTLKSAVERGGYVVPPSIQDTTFEGKYRSLMERSLDFVRDNDNPEAMGVLPHATTVYDLIHINGWNAVHSIGKRTCDKAQWEIRRIAKDMARGIRSVAPEVGKYAVPQGITYGGCPEAKSCGKCPTKD